MWHELSWCLKRSRQALIVCIMIFMTVIGSADARVPTGTLVLIGGALAAPGDEILGALKTSVKELCAREGRRRPRVAFIPSSKRNLAQAHEDFETDDADEPARYPSYRDWFTRAGFDPLLVPITQETVFGRNNAAEDPKNAELIRSCQIVFLMGGDQGKHAMCLLRRDGTPTEALRAIRDVYERGGAVVGTSAGTHALSNSMFGWGESGMTILHSRLESFAMSDLTPKSPVEPKREGNCAGLPGLGLLPAGMLTDTHFDARGRLGRLIVGLRDLGLRWGIGVDENTALFWRDGRGTVVGEHGVFIVDTSAATFSAVGEPFSARQVCVSLLTSGDQWNSTDGTVVSTKPPITTSASRPVESVDVFSARKTGKGDRRQPYATTAVMRSLAITSENEVKDRAWPPFESIWVRFRKSPETRCYGAPQGSITISGMSLDFDRRPLFPRTYRSSRTRTEALR